VLKEGAILAKYGEHYEARKGEVARLVSFYHPARLSLTVSQIKEETTTVKSIRLVSDSGYHPPFLAGQYLNLFVEIGGVHTSRPYSIASAPTQTGHYEITVRKVEDGFVSDYLLTELKPGDGLTSSGPAGNFHHNPLFHGEKLAFIAGGSGITPFMSQIRELADRCLRRRIHLFYGCRKEDDVIFQMELEHIAAAYPNFTWDLIVSEPDTAYRGLKGFITAQLIKERLGDIDWMFYLCGPPAMYQFCLPQLEQLGIPANRIRVELMGTPKEITASPGWPEGVTAQAQFTVAIKGKGIIPALAGEPLMIALERAHFPIPALCRSGECSLCRTKLLAGQVYQPPSVKLRKSDRTFGYIHPCMAYPISDLELML